MNPSTKNNEADCIASAQSVQSIDEGRKAQQVSSTWVLISHHDYATQNRSFEFKGKNFVVICDEDSLITLLTSEREISQIVVDDTIPKVEQKQWVEIIQALAPSVAVNHIAKNAETANGSNALPISTASAEIETIVCNFKATHLPEQGNGDLGGWQRSPLLTTPNVGEWTWDLGYSKLRVSDYWRKIMGLQDQEDIRYQDWIARIHCRDQRGFEIAMDRLLADRTKSMSYEFRKTEPDGFNRWILCRGEICNEQGNNSNVLRGFITDITHVRSVDKLTGLGNHSALDARLENWLSQIRIGNSHGLSIVSFNVGNCKLINDCHGHLIADELIKIIAERLMIVIADNQNAFAARLNTDDFAVVLNHTASTRDAEQLSFLIQDVVSQPIQIEDEAIYPKIDIGISFTQNGNKSSENLIREASTALYHSKSVGNNEFQFFNREMLEVAKHRLKLEGEIRRGIENDEFVVHFQPIVDSNHDKMVGAEALLRWEHPAKGLVGPIEFIDFSEESTLIIDLGEIVLSKCCDTLAEWAQHEFMKDLYCNINVSRKQLGHKDFTQVLQKNIQRTSVDANKIQLEITESAMFDQTINPARILQSLKELNVKVALDDFGTGYSSLSCIHKLPLDTLKIDRSFVKDLESDKSAETIVDAIITLAKGFGLSICAEGIETEFQKEFFRQRNCSIGQGYFYSKPLPYKELIEFAQTKGRS